MIQVSVALMLYLWTEHFANSSGIGEVSVSGDLQWIIIPDGKNATKEPLRGGHVSRGTEHGVNQIACPINRAVERSTGSFIRFPATLTATKS